MGERRRKVTDILKQSRETKRAETIRVIEAFGLRKSRFDREEQNGRDNVFLPLSFIYNFVAEP